MKTEKPYFEIISFGEKVKEYNVRVVNEREVRAGAGILFLFAMIAFSSAWLIGDFYFMKVFVTFFVLDFIMRVLINPKYSPTLILGRFIVKKQTVEYSGAPQKRFAWGLGLILGIIMFFLVVIQQSFGPINLLLCVTCLTLLFFESAFGICIGCKLYNFVKKEDGQLCPGGVCTPHKEEPIQKIDILQVVSVIFLFIVMSVIISSEVYSDTDNKIEELPQIMNDIESIGEDCTVPGWAIDIGHEDQWKLHNGCN